MLKGVIYTVTCDTLGCPATKEGSYRAANEWWVKKHASLLGHRFPPAVADRLGVDQSGEALPWTADDWTLNEIARILKTAPDRLMALSRRQLKTVLKEETETTQDETPNVPTIAIKSQEWIEKETGRARAGQLKPRSLTNTITCLKYFATFAGELNPVTSITGTILDQYYQDLLRLIAGGLGQGNARERMGVATRFTRWLVETIKDFEVPRNLEKKWKFEVLSQGASKPATYGRFKTSHRSWGKRASFPPQTGPSV